MNIKNAKTFFPDNTIYFLTGTCWLHHPYFREYAQKQILLNQIKKINKIRDIIIAAYSIAINHYHLLLYLKHGLDLSKIKQLLHGGASFIYRKNYPVKYKEFWQDSRAYIIPKEKDYWRVVGYITGNLLKHKEVSTFYELKENPFSSYKYIADKYGDKLAEDLVRSVIDVGESAEGVIDWKGLKQTKVWKPSAKAG